MAKSRRPRIRKYQVAQYQRDALDALKPPEDLLVSEWAERYRVLDSKTSAMPGPWRNDKTPYLAGIMDELCNYETEEVIFVKPSQVGGTECLQNMLGWVVHQDPSPAMIVYPTDTLGESIVVNRLRPMLNASEPLRQRFRENDSTKAELQFDGMYLSIVGSNSPRSWPARLSDTCSSTKWTSTPEPRRRRPTPYRWPGSGPRPSTTGRFLSRPPPPSKPATSGRPWRGRT